MNVEFTGRQYEVTPAVRKQVEHGLEKLSKILGDTFDTHVVLSTEKRRHKAEITVLVRASSLVGIAEATEMTQAVNEAIEKIDRQAVRYRTKNKAKKRIARKAAASGRWNGNATAESDTKVMVGTSETTAVDVLVHTFPGTVRVKDAHVVAASEAVAMRPMTLEEAVKEAEFRDREVFVFRDHAGQVRVLHRKKDGKMELIEVP
ncbi:MAG TPA: ribosome-associated translation inhibitor RaiA [Terriglobales bacterium]|nr:ribosome-associated translation inhibitor RaiA [Terriglobales bacterium]